MSKRELEEVEARTYAFFTFYQEGSYGHDELVAKGEQAGSRVTWTRDWKGKAWESLEEGEWKQLRDEELVFRVPMRTPLAKTQVKRVVKPKRVVNEDESSSSESWETSQARAYLRYA